MEDKYGKAASLALFKVLYNSGRCNNLLDIVSEFVRNAIVLRPKEQYTTNDLKTIFREQYGFDLPESVIKSAVRKLTKSGEFLKTNSVYTPNQDFSIRHKKSQSYLSDEIRSITEKQSYLFTQLYTFIETRTKCSLGSNDKQLIDQSFINFLMGNSSNEDQFTPAISSFIVERGATLSDKDVLNEIKEGIILYQGITYSESINEAEQWNDLTIFLATEHLFNAVGYNTRLYKDIFDDFISLVNQINSRNGGKGDTHIKLRYLEETKIEVESFFHVAEGILRGQIPYMRMTDAMEAILDGCQTPADLQQKKSRFELSLRKLGIEYFDFSHFELKKEYNISGLSILEQLEKQYKENNRVYNEDETLKALELFTKINTLRRGNSPHPIQSVRYIYMTANSNILYLSNKEIVKKKKSDTPFAIDIDLLTTLFWFSSSNIFHLIKNRDGHIPTSLDAITKAKRVLSSLLNETVENTYEKCLRDIKEGKITKEEATQLLANLKLFKSRNTEITEENASLILDVIQDSDTMQTTIEEDVSYYKNKAASLEEENEQYKEDRDKLLCKNRDAYAKGKLQEDSLINLQAEAYATKKFKKERIKAYREVRTEMIIVILCFLLFFLQQVPSISTYISTPMSIVICSLLTVVCQGLLWYYKKKRNNHQSICSPLLLLWTFTFQGYAKREDFKKYYIENKRREYK